MSSTTSSSSGSCTTRVSTPLSDTPELESNDSKPLPPGPPPSPLFSRAATESITVHTADGAEFHVPRQFLAEASPLLENWTAPSPGCNTPASIAIQSETGEAVETLLRLCHPLAPAPHFPTLDAMKGALALGWKYELRGGARDRMARALEPWLKTGPVRLYVFAVEEDKLELMAAAAKASLRLAGTLADHEELDAISTRAYRRLLTYRGACAAKVADIASYGAVYDRRWVWRSCKCGLCETFSPWFAAFYASLTRTLRSATIKVAGDAGRARGRTCRVSWMSSQARWTGGSRRSSFKAGGSNGWCSVSSAGPMSMLPPHGFCGGYKSARYLIGIGEGDHPQRNHSMRMAGATSATGD